MRRTHTKSVGAWIHNRRRRLGTEADTKRAIAEYLTVEQIWFMRVQAGAARPDKHFLQLAPAGTFDYFAMLPPYRLFRFGPDRPENVVSGGTPFWIEVKRARLQGQSDKEWLEQAASAAQKAFQEFMGSYMIPAVIVDSVDALKRVLPPKSSYFPFQLRQLEDWGTPAAPLRPKR